ncbi:MAG TPA: cytochrome-c oxidase, cbb3-type subunit III [Sphingomicrobium sp.]
MADEKRRIDQPTGTETVGHEWDGIEELNTPLPRWWLWTLYATIVWAIAYTVAYPAWPMIREATAGVLDWSSRGQLEKQLAAEQLRKSPIVNAIAATPIGELENDPRLMQAAIEGGRAAFRQNCVQCHGSGAAGAKGYPNLNDDDWLWGGDMASIHHSVEHGIRNPGSEKTRMSQMPAFGRDGLLQPAEIEDLTAYVRTVSRQRALDASAKRGASLYQTNCAACHGNDARGNREFGAPNLTDAIWLYGGDQESVRKSIHDARFGVMPAWGGKLNPATTKMLAAYVHSLGGGERQKVQMAKKDK